MFGLLTDYHDKVCLCQPFVVSESKFMAVVGIHYCYPDIPNHAHHHYDVGISIYVDGFNMNCRKLIKEKGPGIL